MPDSKKVKGAIDKIQALQLIFADKLAERIEELLLITLGLNTNDACDSQDNQQLLKNIHNLSHKLAGSAGTFQFHDVYVAAKELEEFCHTLLEKTEADSKGDGWYQNILDLQAMIQTAAINKTAKPMKIAADAGLISAEIKHNIILVDDDELLSALLKEQIKNFGFDITCLSNPNDLASFLENHTPEVILMDIIFPNYDFNGIDLIKDLKAKAKINCPVIFLSNRDDFDARLEAVRSGAQGYVVKPVQTLELVEILDRYTDRLADKSYRVLIVDDDNSMLDFYQNALEADGFMCKSVQNPILATEALIDFKPNVILLDVDMPSCNGFELAEVIRQNNAFTHIPILFLTADKNCELAALKAGGDCFLNKKLDVHVLIASVRSHCRRSKELHAVIGRLRQDELRFQSVSRSSLDAIIMFNQAGHIIFWNEGAESIFGYQSNEIIGQSFDMLMHGISFKELSTDNNAVSYSIESEGITKEQQIIAIDLSYTEWHSGGDLFFTSIIRDMSERKLMLNSIIDSKDVAEKANKAKSIFLSNMSHELRTPLNAILGFTQILELDDEKNLISDQLESLAYIHNAGNHLLMLINEVLDLSVIESGKVAINLEQLDWVSLLTKSLELIAPQASSAEITIVNELPDNLSCFIYADALRLGQVFDNLLTNAIKYNNVNGRVFVRMSCIENCYRLMVEDTGKGIPDKYMADLFKPFSRLGLENSAIEGTGIGLTITKKLVEMMDGRIGVDSIEGQGCTFWVEFPKIIQVNDNLEILENKDKGKKMLEATHQEKNAAVRVLYIEDNMMNQILMKKIILRAGFEYDVADTGGAGIEKAIQNKPDIILLDIDLPDMSGYQVFETLKANDETKDIIVIGVSANAMLTDIEKGRAIGLTEYITKPINTEEIIKVINQSLGLKK